MENFVVSARKYRPAVFESVVGQGHITSTLKNAIGRGQLAHAYLFCGPRGVGKTTCARIFAKAINCLSPVDSDACGECESCRGFNEGRSFNIHELDAASNNSVDDIRSLTEQVRIPPQIGRYSVYIIDEVHMLSASAFNAFLKTLEEPPAHAVFILATTEKHKIIPTILSRCQIYDFNRIRVEDGVNYLRYIAGKEGVECDDESLHLIAQKADGGMRDALSMFDKAVSFCGSDLKFKEVARTLNVLDYDTYFKITSLILAGDYPSVLTAFDEVLRNGFTPQTFVGGLNSHLRDLLMGKSPQTAALLEVTGELLERYKKQGADCDVGFLFEAIAVLTSVDGTLRTATNQRLNVELGLMKLCGLGQKKNDQAVNPGSAAGIAATQSLSVDSNSQPGDHSAGAASVVSSGGVGMAADIGINPSSAFVGRADSAKEAPLPGLIRPQTTPNNVINITNNSGRIVVPGDIAAQNELKPAQSTQIMSGVSSASSEAAIVGVTGSETASTPEVSMATSQNAQEQPKPSNAHASTVTTDVNAATSHGAVGEAKVEPSAAFDSGAELKSKSQASADRPSDEKTAGRKIGGRPMQTISGASIESLLNAPKNIHDAVSDDDSESTVDHRLDPRSEEKIIAVREAFLGKLDRKWPRIAVTLGAMVVSGNKISATVPTRPLYEEVMRNRSEILTMLAEMAGVEGVIELSVEIKEVEGSLKPIKAEDRLKFMQEQNPLIDLLRKKLDLDLE